MYGYIMLISYSEKKMDLFFGIVKVVIMLKKLWVFVKGLVF